ncbi:MAG TPA: CHAT domain-containing protein [Chitinophagaceae bacterium]|nr:CHAT domain-containing protein [Chitinophagaceae bacterium]
MGKKILFSLLLFSFLLSLSQTDGLSYESALTAYKKANKDYDDAEKISLSENYDEQREEQLNKSSLAQFARLCKELSGKGSPYDSLLFHSFIKAGVLYHYFDSTDKAKESYSSGLRLKYQIPDLPDSFSFKPLVYLGGILYTENKFDSARLCYKEAENIAANYKKRLSESERLLNTLGALYFEAGNYAQAKNYFTKAINSVSISGETAKTLTANYKINLAATLTKLEDYENAEKIYEELLPYDIYKQNLLHNIGFIKYKTGKPEQALSYYRRISYTDKTIIRLYNDMSQAFIDLGNKDSALHYLHLALKENEKWNSDQKSLQHGITLKYLGDLEFLNGRYSDALTNYQLAIIQFLPDFANTGIHTNPEKYSGIFSYINLFHTLIAKAHAFEKLYDQNKQIETLNDALETYSSAFNLTDYVEKTYNSDEARLFLGKLKYTVHSKPIDISLQLYNFTSDKEYLEQAWQFDQRNKASVLSLNVRENEWKKKSDINPVLLEEEESAMSAITRLSLRAQQISDSTELSRINSNIRDIEISLGKTREKLKQDPSYKKLNIYDNTPSIADFQNQLGINTGLISFHLSETELLAILITKNDVGYYKLPVGKEFFDQLESFQKELYNTSPEHRYNGKNISSDLYQKLMFPFSKRFSQLKRLVIIPDDELNYLPFEALVDENNHYLVESFSFTYQYSAALLESKEGRTKNTATFSLAPYSSKGYVQGNQEIFSQLASSSKEISNTRGKKLLDSNATKENFLKNSNKYNIIHLATHASIDNSDPLASFIAFSPNEKDFKLYAREVYNLHMDSVHLIILSACETGTGKLVKGEGLMSLSRAFTYAGCPNIITSLWKAEDKTTAYLGNRLHKYLDEGLGYDVALQRSKIDLLKSRDIDPRFKTPDYWSHLILIGNYESAKNKNNWIWLALFIVVASIVYIFLIKGKKTGKREKDLFSA